MKFQSALVAALLAMIAFSAAAETIAITGARVHTMSAGGVLENATIIIENGRINAVGIGIDIPANAKRIDASGKIVTPGIFSPFGQLGLVEVGAVEGSVDSIQRGTQFSAGFDIADAYNPRSSLIAINRSEGITSALIAPQPAEPDLLGHVSAVFSGLASVVSLRDGSEFIQHRGVALVANLGETGSSLAGGSRAAALQTLRLALDDARDYRQNKAAYLRGAWREYSISGPDLDALQPVLDGITPLLARVDRASDISMLAGLAKEYGLRIIIVGGAEAWMVATELAAADIAVILDAINNLPVSFDEINARLDSAKMLAAAGVRFTFGAESSSQTHNARNITQAAGIAVANGLDWATALRAITLVPAQIFGMTESFGNIAPGKSADLIVWPGDPLELTSFPEAVFVAGKAVAMENRQTMLRDRYLNRDASKPPAFHH